MSGIQFTIFSHGFIEHDEAFSYAILNPGTVENKHPIAVWERLPMISVLIKHPEAGNILYDTGICPGDEGPRRSKRNKELFLLDVTKEDYLDARLASVGLTPDDIDILVLSHSHWDHNGGLKFFSHTKAGQNIIVYEKDYVMGLKETHEIYKKESAAYIKENFEFEGLSYNLIEGDQTLVDGIEMIELPGHSPAVLGLVIHLDSGTVIFPSDAVYSARNYGPPTIPPGIIYDTLSYERSIKKLRAIQKKYNAKIFYPHDPEQFNEFKLAPYFYK